MNENHTNLLENPQNNGFLSTSDAPARMERTGLIDSSRELTVLVMVRLLLLLH